MAFFWFQITGGEDAWLEATSEHRSKILQERQPAFMTVLDAHSSPDKDWDREEYAKMKYSGPLYVDFDAESIKGTIPEFQKFLANLQEMGVNLRSLRLYATGGRGFHIEIPPQVFMEKVPKTGVTALPYVYREMAMQMVVDTLDLRVYTGRKGRMWRTPGIERSNGKFKVPVSVDDAMAMTPELYDELCAAPIPEPERDLPEFNTALGAMFIKCQSRMDEAMKRRTKGNADQALLLKYKGQFPPTIERIMRGEGLAPGVGFQKLSMQLAITANALGKTADQLVEAAEGLCKSHEGDSSRYNSPRKRKEELRRMWEYTHDNPCYGYSRGAIRSLVDVDTPTSDLDGLTGGTAAAIGSVPDSDGDEDEALPEDLQAEITSAGSALLEGLIITRTGIHKRTSEGAKTICNIGFRKPTLLVDPKDHMVIGLEAEVLSDGVSSGRKGVPGKSFMSRAALSQFCSSFGGIFSGTDTQAGAVNLMLTRSAKKGNRVVYALHKEGLDVVQNPMIKDRVQHDVVWVHADKVVSENTEAQYVYQPAVSAAPTFRSDLHLAAEIVDTPDTLEWIRHLFRINDDVVVAQMLGWFVSCFHKPFYHEAYKQFPLLHPNGPAGSGKSMSSELMARMHYLTTRPIERSCVAAKEFALKVALTGSASIPVLFDEYKPRQMKIDKRDFLQDAFRNAYNGGVGAMGGISRGNAAGSFREITEFALTTPIVYLSESQEMQSAIVQRSLPLAFTKDNAQRHTAHYDAARAGHNNMSGIGRLILKYAYRETIESRRAALDPLIESVKGLYEPGVNARQIYNLAVVFAGIDTLDYSLRTVFGDKLRPDMDRLRGSLYEQKAEINMVAMSEAAKAMSDIALITRTEEPDSEFAIREGKEYVVMNGHIDVLMRDVFVKYFSWCKRKGVEPLYDGVDSFAKAMEKFSPFEDRLCIGSPLKTTGLAKVFRFNLEKLGLEGVDVFKTKGGREHK